MKKEKEYTRLFKEKIRSRGWKFSSATRNEDMYDHIDCHVGVVDYGKVVRKMKIDLKGTKYNSRAHEGIKEHMCQYIEFLNVRGNKGWLFGKADYIAILDENEDKFYLIPRIHLIKFCEDLFGLKLRGEIEKIEAKLLATNEWVKRSDQSHHKLYRRHNRQDIVTQIDMDDVKSMCKITI
jgi:hypothetical protein